MLFRSSRSISCFSVARRPSSARSGERTQSSSTAAGHMVDLTKVTNDIFILAGVTDHITPWKACYRSTHLFGSKNIEFVLSQSGHIQAILNPPGNPKAKFFRSAKAPPQTPEAWMGQVDEHAGSWWPFWMEWLKNRSGKAIKAPAKLGSKKHPVGDAAPGRYVID